MARKCESCEISLFPMAKRKKRSTRRKRRVGSTCSCKKITIMDVVYGVGGGIASLAISAVAKKVIAKLPTGSQGIVTKLFPAAKVGLAIYGSSSIKNSSVKTAALSFGITAGLEVAMQVPAIKKYASLAGTGDLFDMIGNTDDVVYLPIGDEGGVDNNQNFFTEEAVLGTEDIEDMYSDIAVL